MANMCVFDLLLSYQLLKEGGEDDICPVIQVQHRASVSAPVTTAQIHLTLSQS